MLDAFPDPSAAPSGGAPEEGVEPARVLVPRRCPEEMVDVGGAFCIDRYEISLVDAAQGRLVSPSYHPTRERTVQQFELWTKRSRHDDTALARSLPVPAPPPFQLEEDFHVRAVSQARVVPNGYLTRDVAEQACEAAGKRLCSQSEWVHACRGDRHTRFPYGATYVEGQCNVNREAHPARLLHGNSSIHHLDPRLPLVESDHGPLLRETGATATCQSHWGDDAIFDMVGNLDEWIDDQSGTFVGGFYSRATKDGCESVITVHGPTYFDYSLGARCCRETGAPPLGAPPLGAPPPLLPR